METDTIKAGTKVTCPQCHDVIAVLACDLDIGMRIDDSQFYGIQKPIRNGMRMVCEKCSADYYKSGKIHTEHGWLP